LAHELGGGYVGVCFEVVLHSMDYRCDTKFLVLVYG
jgi:hypothetical protein